jgi:hypothetical protein
MNIRKACVTLARLLLTIILIAAPLSAQRRRPATPKPQPPAQPAQPAPSFDSILATDSYRVYGEVRGVGQLLRSSGVNDILGPLVKLASPPKEFKTVVNWLDSQSDALMSSRLMFAAMPSRAELPQVLLVIEFDSTEEAQKFEPKLKRFLPKLLPPPAPASSPEAPKAANAEPTPPKADASSPSSPPPPQFVVKQFGPLVFLSEKPVSLKTLRPAGSKLLTEDNNFRQAHSRFSSDSIFLYVDVASFTKEDQERRRIWEEEERKRAESEAANPQKTDEEAVLPEEAPSPDLLLPDPTPPIVVEPSTQGRVGPAPDAQIAAVDEFSVTTSAGPGMVLSPSTFSMFASALFSGPPKWPEALGVAINFEADSYVVRALLINEPEVKGNIVPFIPQLVSGPPLALEASSILPADTELLITASLDYPQIYDGLKKSMMRQYDAFGHPGRLPVKGSPPESPFAAYEAKLGLKIKEDLLPLLGNEIAISVPMKTLGFGVSQPSPSPSPSTEQTGEDQAQKAAPPPEPQPLVVISVRDKETLRKLIPKIIDNVGFKGASSLLAQSEKRGDTELVSYGDFLSYAFIENFLVASPDTKSVRHVVDSYLNHQTLSSDARFRDATRWQPRQVLGQVYMPTELMEAYYELLRNPLGNNSLRDFVSQLSPVSTPVTYAVSNEGLGPLHELHLPKNLVMFMIAGMATESNQSPITTNEAVTKSALTMIVNAESMYKSDKGNGSFGSLEQLMEENFVPKEMLEKYGYKIELTVTGTKFEATAVPVEYGKTGMMSFFIDESGVLRGADRGGAPASLVDNPIK